MKTNFKVVAFTAIAALGLVSTGAVAQPKSHGLRDRAPASQQAPQNQEMRQGGDSMMPMMADPEMRQQMLEMMKKCNQMMDRMAKMPHGEDNAN